MSEFKQEKNSVNYFKKSDTPQYIGGGLLIVSLTALWLGWGMISYIFAIIGAPCWIYPVSYRRIGQGLRSGYGQLYRKQNGRP